MRVSALWVASVLASCNSHSPEHDEQCEDTYEGFVSVPPPEPIPPGTFGFVLLDVGQGDAAVVVAPSGCAALLDGGPSGAGNAVIKPSLAALGVTSLDFAVNSHFHADHLGGIDEVDVGTDAVPIATVYDRGGSYDSVSFSDYATHFSRVRSAVRTGDIISLCGEVTFEVVSSDANGTSTSNENARSVVVKISYGAFDALVGGDLTGSSPDIESTIAASIGELELYKVHHHASSTSSNATFLSATMPTVSLIPVGANNTYGHPHPDTLSRLEAVNTEIWQTENPTNGTALGHIRVTSVDGETYEVRQGSRSSTHVSKGGTPTPDTTPPSTPTNVAATPSGSRIDVTWSASTDNVGVSHYVIRRDGLTFATTTGTSYANTNLGPGETYTYDVSAADAAGNVSAASAPVTATTPPIACTVAITQAQYSKGKRELLVRATSSQQPSVSLSVSADGTDLGPMTFLPAKDYYELSAATSRPSCVTVTASCGGSATHCGI